MSVLAQNPYMEQQEPKVEPAQVWPLEKAQSPFSETFRPAVGVLAAEEEEVAVLAQEVTKSVTTVVAVTPPVIVSVIVGLPTVGAGRVTVAVEM